MASRDPAERQTQGDSAGGRTVWAVVAFIGLLLVVLTAGLAHTVWREYGAALARAEERAANAAHTAEQHVRWLVEASVQALHRVDGALAANPGAVTAGDVRDLQAIVRSLPVESSIWVFDAAGDSVLATDRRELPVNVADRPYFTAHESGAEWHIGRLLTARVNDRPVFTVSRRLERDGGFAGVAVVFVPAELMSAFYATLGLGSGSSVGLIRDDGWLVARHPVLPEAIDLSGHVLFAEHLPSAPAGIYHSPRSPADAMARIVAYRRVAGLPLIVVVGVSRDAVLERLWSRLAGFGAIGAPVLAVLLLGSGWVVVLLRRDERRRRELAAALAQNQTLLREMHHRLKNNLQIVASLVNLQPGPPEAKAEMMRRIAAMAAVHEQIYLTNQFATVSLSDYLRRVASGLKEAFGTAVELRCELAPISVDVETALPLGLIMSEIVSNAFKHAFPHGGGGTIAIALRPDGEEAATLRIRDDGVGFDPDRPATGLGMRLVRGLAQQFGGRYRFETDGGTAFVLTFPVVRPSEPSSATAQAAAPVRMAS